MDVLIILIANAAPTSEIGTIRNQLSCLFNKLLSGIILRPLTNKSLADTTMKAAKAIHEFLFAFEQEDMNDMF